MDALTDKDLDLLQRRLRAVVGSGESLPIGRDDGTHTFTGHLANGITKHNDIRNQRVARDNVFDLFGVDVFPLAIDDKRFFAATDGEETICIYRGKVSGTQPFAVKGLAGGGNVFEVPFHDDRTADLQLADAHLVGIRQPDFDIRQLFADSADARLTDVGDERPANLSQAIAFDNRYAFC